MVSGEHFIGHSDFEITGVIGADFEV